MAGRTKSNKYVGRVTRQIVAKNLATQLKRLYGDKKNHILLFENDYGVNFSTTQRILDEDVGVTIDTLELIAAKLEIAVHELLIPPADVQRMMKVSVQSSTDVMVRRTDESREQAVPAKSRRGSR